MNKYQEALEILANIVIDKTSDGFSDPRTLIDTKNARNQAATQQNNVNPYKYMDKQEQGVESKFGG